MRRGAVDVMNVSASRARRWPRYATLLVILLVAGLAAAAPKPGKNDRVWTNPEFPTLAVEKIAVLPVATYDNSLEAEKQVELAFGTAFRNLPYRWVSATTTRDLLRARSNGNDSLIKVIKGSLLKNDRVDSLLARQLTSWLRSGAVLSLRVDLWERQQLEWNQSGRPATSVMMRASLVDSAGRLLWSAAGSQRGEGSYQDPNAGISGVKVSGLETGPITAQAGAPSFAEVLGPLFTRWAQGFPSKSAVSDSLR